MSKRPTFTEAELRRAMKVAADFGLSVEIARGVIRIVEPTEVSGLGFGECADRIDKAFGCGT